MKKLLVYTVLTIFALTIFSSSARQLKKPRNCNSSDIEKVDTCLIGQPLKKAIETLGLDTSQFYTFDEPPKILRGINISLADSCEISIYVERTSILNFRDSLSFRQQYQYIVDKKIIGISWRKEKRKKSNMVFKH